MKTKRKRSFGTLRKILGGSLLTLAMLCAPTVALATVVAQKSDTAAANLNGKVIADTGSQCDTYGMIHKEALDLNGAFAITANTNNATNNDPASVITTTAGSLDGATQVTFTATTVNTADGPNIATNAGINRTFVHRATTNGPNVIGGEFTDSKFTNGAFATIGIDTSQHLATSTG